MSNRTRIFTVVSAMYFAVAIQANVAAAASQTQSGAQPANTSSKGCIAVKSIGSHAFRNVMLAGLVGALISKEQYEVLDVVDYPTAKIGQKFHGNDLQIFQAAGTKVVILDKKSTKEEIAKACR